MLDPKIAVIMRDGGDLVGQVDVTLGSGMGGWLARRLGFPAAGRHQFQLSVQRDGDQLVWSRHFIGHGHMVSRFQKLSDNLWTETIAGLTLFLSVDTTDGGWRWQLDAARLLGCPLPQYLWPNVTAAKHYDGDVYQFKVRLALAPLGLLATYQGALTETPTH